MPLSPHRVVSWLTRILFLLVVVTRPAWGQPPGEAAPPDEPADAEQPPPDEQAEDETLPVPTDAPAAADETLATPPEMPRLPPSEAEKARGLPIQSIEVAGNRRITDDDIRTVLKGRVGDPFDPDVLTQDVRELYAAGFFEDIEVDLSRTDTGVTLRFLVREKPTVASVEFSGVEELDESDIREAIEIKATTVLSHPAVRRSIQKIRDMYAEKGFFLAEVESEVVPQKNNEVIVRFSVVEHEEVTVRRITFIGNHNISDQELRELMFTGNPGFFGFGTGGPFRQDAFERDIAIISAIYYDRGFLAVTINTPRVMLTPDRSGIEISITIEEGPRYRIRQLRVFEQGPDGREVEPIGGRRNLRMMIRAEAGDYFNRAALFEDLQAIRTLYRDHGYANVEANPQPQLDPERQEVDLIIPIVRGPLVYFERLEIRGNAKTRDKVIRREFEVHEGEKFHETNLERSKQRVTALGYFERVDISTEEGSAPDRISVIFEVSERPTGTFQVGAGFSSIERFIATAQIQEINLFGNGQSLAFQAQVSGIRRLGNLRFHEPYFLDSRFDFSVDLFDQLRNYQQFSQQSRGGSVGFGYDLIEPELNASLAYTLELEEVSTEPVSTFFGTSAGVSVFQRLPLANLFNDGITSSIRPTLTYDTRDNRLFPTSGIFLRGSTELATSVIGSENEFLRHKYTGRFFYPVGAGFVLKFNTEAGLVTSPSRDGVPIFARFFLGGILDVRGFDFRSIGPRLPLPRITDPNAQPIDQGAVIGGNLMYFQNLELEFPIVEAVGVRGVVFTDAGNAWNLENTFCEAAGAGIRFEELSPCFNGIDSLTTLRTSWGFGIRWFSPLGPLRFEWGFPFKPLPFEDSSAFEFTIGNFF